MGTSERYDAIVIGAGPSGLAAGLRLALFEKRVVVLERHALWGGLNSFYKRGGRRIDTGLHALTNFVPPGVRNTPLPKLLRQLRIGRDELLLAEQSFSEIAFPGVRLAFTNRFEHFESEVARAFPSQRDGFGSLVRAIAESRPFEPHSSPRSARAELARHLDDPLLAEMLMLPMLYYGGAREHDLEWSEFVILWRSILEEGLARPEGGIKRVLDLLVARLREAGGELRTRAGVARVVTEAGAARGVVLEDGGEIEAEHVLSSAGWPETLAMCGRPAEPEALGRISFVESITFLDRLHADLGHRATITFFNDSEWLRYERPETPIDARSGVVCCGDNYAAAPGEVREGVQRVTVLANHDLWSALAEPDYLAAKQQAEGEMLAASSRFVPDPRPHATLRDMFTPRTIRHYTSHFGGCVYGSPEKRRDGRTGIANLSLVGTDQGLCGIVGSMLSGVMIANDHVLAAGAGAGRAHA